MVARRFKQLIVVASLFFAATASAEQSESAPTPGPRAIVGTVADQSGTPLVAAEVALLIGDRVISRALTDSGGRFEIPAPLDGVRVRVQHAGYERRTIAVAPGRTGGRSTVFVTLDKIGLAGGDVAGINEIDSLPSLQGFFHRAMTNQMGHYLTPKRLEQLHPRYVSDALRYVPGVTVQPARIGNLVLVRGCAPLVWVDGSRARGSQPDDLASGPEIAAIEVYDSSAGVPPEFADRSATCGTVLLWTRDR